ncbi:MAG TPA: type II secretion system F family protein [Chthoniobacterales bacterium]|nr:type II secretion system F family protein [Chthoniobacterales bacterium]
MPIFNYRAFDVSGNQQTGILDAPTQNEAYRLLREKGLQPSSLKEEGGGTKKVESKKGSLTESAADLRLTRLTTPQLLFFTEELAELLEAGLQLEGALKVIEQRQEKSPVKGVAAILRSRVREGISFSKALRECGQSFDPLYCNLVAAGEASGALPQILKKQCAHLEMIEDLRKKVTSSLVYPSIVFASALLLMFIFLTFLVPQLSVLLSKSGQKLPAITQCLIWVSEFCGHWWWAILAFIGAVITGIRMALKTPVVKSWWHRAMLDIVVIGPVLKTTFLAELLETLATLVSNGVTMLAGLNLLQGATGNVYLRGLLHQISALVSEGNSLARSMKRVGFFPPVLIDILSVGEQTGDISGALARAAKRYDRELSSKIGHLTTLIQPAVILLVALFVGVVAYSMIAGILTSVNALKH